MTCPHRNSPRGASFDLPGARACLAAVLACTIAACGDSGSKTTAMPVAVAPAWPGFAGDAQHSALGSTTIRGGMGALPLNRIAWTATVDLLQPTTNAIHYGSPLVSSGNTVIVPQKTGAAGGFSVQALDGGSGALRWSATSDYLLPPLGAYTWIPSYGPTLTPASRLVYAGSGGKLYFRDAVDSASAAVNTVAFYGLASYKAAPAQYDSAVYINTPITSDASGNLYFGFRVVGTGGALASGYARVGADGNCPTNCAWVPASAALGALHSADPVTSAMNAAPALSVDGKLVYVVASTLPATGNPTGYLLALDAATLASVGGVALIDPATLSPAYVTDSSSATPLVGPDGDVYYGVLESNLPAHNDRGWLLHFDRTLATPKTPGSFGWDNTPSVVPSRLVAAYAGGSSYLLLTKYNNYADFPGGDGQNKMAILDPNGSEPDPVNSSVTVMKEVITLLGPTPDPAFTATKPLAVKEWCVNTGAVDPGTRSVYVNSEDGVLYRWDLSTPAGSIAQSIRLNAGVPQAYTPTVLGPDGTVYSINSAVLNAARN